VYNPWNFSGVGPTFYIVLKSDLRPLSPTNVLSNADDINLLVPQYCDVDMASEFDHVLCWAKRNTRPLSYRKGNRAMRLYMGACPENFRESLSTPTVIFPEIFNGLLLRAIL